MEISLPTRVNVVAWVLGAALVAMSVSAIGAPLGLAATPAMKLIETHVNPVVGPMATLLSCITVWLVLLALRWASGRGTTRPGSIVARNQAVFASARVVALVYLAQLIVALAASEIEWFFQVPFFNVTQLSVLSVPGRVFMAIVLPLIGIVVLLLLAPRIPAAGSRGGVQQTAELPRPSLSEAPPDE
jgi:hypothetical protein